MSDKPYLTIQQQIKMLEDRGVIIEDYEDAQDFLYRNNYYRISGYTLTLRQDDVFYDWVKFSDIQAIYNLDFELRTILLKYLLNVETTIKSVYAHEFAKAYEPNAYLKDANFTNKHNHKEIIEKSESLRSKQIKTEAYIKHYENKKQPMPIWAYVGALTFTDISKLYGISQNNLTKTISDYFHIFSPKILANHLHCLSLLRNVCAHGNRLYDRAFTYKANLSKKEKNLLIKEEKVLINNRLYSYILCFKNLLKDDEFKQLLYEINKAIKSFPNVDISYYGLKKNWYKEIS